MLARDSEAGLGKVGTVVVGQDINAALGDTLRGLLTTANTKKLLKELAIYDNQLDALARMSQDRLARIVGPQGATRISAAIGLAQALATRPTEQGGLLDDPSVAAGIFRQMIGHEPCEKMAVIYLDVRLQMIAKEVLFSGTENEVLCPPRVIIRRAIEVGAMRFIVAHNHPTGSTVPSSEDISLTRQLKEAGELVCIPCIDHLVVTQFSYASIRSVSGIWG